MEEGDKRLQDEPRFNLKKKAMLEAMKKSLGNISAACNLVGVSRKTYYEWIGEDEEFNEAIEAINEQNIDFVESKLLEKINGKTYHEETREFDAKGKLTNHKKVTKELQPDTEAIKFFLKTKGKKRGYIEKQEFDVNGKYIVDFSEDGDKTPNKAPMADGLSA